MQLVIRPQHAGACNACAGGKKAHFGAEATCESLGVSPVVSKAPTGMTQKFQLLELQIRVRQSAKMTEKQKWCCQTEEKNRENRHQLGKANIWQFRAFPSTSEQCCW